jgi:peptide/nickel transport system permease protein
VPGASFAERGVLTYIAKRLGLAILVAFTVSVINFCLLLISGDIAAAMAGPVATQAELAHIRATYGFDQSIAVQYLNWLGRAVQGDFGQSLYYNLPVFSLILSRVPVTLTLAACAVTFGFALGISAGVLAAMRPDGWVDRITQAMAAAGQAMPSFWFGLMLIVLLSLTVPILPPSGAASWKGFVMPTLVLGFHVFPAVMRLTRSGMLDVMASDYIRTARAKGAGSLRVFGKHALRNAIVPVVSLSAVQFGFMLGGSVVVESVFALPGTGLLVWESIQKRDLPMVQAILLLFSCFYIVMTLLADLLTAWLDPRIRVA